MTILITQTTNSSFRFWKPIWRAKSKSAKRIVRRSEKKQGAKRTVDGIVDAMKNAGQESLVNEYLRMSAFVSDEDRPQPEADETGESFDTSAVMSALYGEWKALRFSAQGNDLPDEAIENLRLTFANGKYVMTMAGGLQVGSYDIDTSGSPMSMDINIKSGDETGQKRMGSFKLLKDSPFAYCLRYQRNRSTETISYPIHLASRSSLSTVD